MQAAVGNAVAGALPVTPLSLPPCCLRSPCGPSAIDSAGIERRGMAWVYMKSVPCKRRAISLSVGYVLSFICGSGVWGIPSFWE